MNNLLLVPMLSIALLSFAGCQSKPTNQAQTVEDNKLPVLDIAAQASQSTPDTFTWNSIAKNARMFPLKTRHLMGLGLQIVDISDNIILMSEGQRMRVYTFDINGKEIHSFRHEGNGPGEYVYLTFVGFNKADSTILVYDNGNNKVMSYSIEGKCLNEVRTSFHGNIKFRDEDGRAFTVNASGSGFAGMLDENYNMKKTYIPFDSLMTDKQKVGTLLVSNRSTTYDRFLLNPVYSDTLYSISKEGANPFCILKKGTHTPPKEELYDIIRMIKTKNDYFIRMNINAFSSYLLVDYSWQGNYAIGIWDLQKETVIAHKVYNAPTPDQKYGFDYVFPSGNKIKLRPCYATHNRLAFIIQAEDCMGEIEGLKEDDNPIVLILDL